MQTQQDSNTFCVRLNLANFRKNENKSQYRMLIITFEVLMQFPNLYKSASIQKNEPVQVESEPRIYFTN